MINYRWTNKYFNADATEVGRELEKIESSNGSLDTRNVVDFAKKNQDSELHKCFEWDNDIASEKYRIFQANQILSSISVVVSESEEQKEITRAYVNIVDSDDNERKYKNIARVLENDDEYEQLKKRAYEDLLRCKDKYSKVLQLEDLKEVIFDLYKNIK